MTTKERIDIINDALKELAAADLSSQIRARLLKAQTNIEWVKLALKIAEMPDGPAKDEFKKQPGVEKEE